VIGGAGAVSDGLPALAGSDGLQTTSLGTITGYGDALRSRAYRWVQVPRSYSGPGCRIAPEGTRLRRSMPAASSEVPPAPQHGSPSPGSCGPQDAAVFLKVPWVFARQVSRQLNDQPVCAQLSRIELVAI
jgi:hypothetical protein